MPLLTISIPTYKRLPLLKTLLENLLPEAQDLGVVVKVNDNCSQDGTAEYLAAMADKFPCLIFSINLKTVPLDENMFLVMNSIETQYIYPLGDDDFLPKGALVAIINELVANEPDILVLSGILTDHKLNPKKNLLTDELMGSVYNDPRSAFHSLWDKMPFGSFVMHRDFIDDVAFRKYFNTCHAYTGIVWDGLCSNFLSGKNVAVRCMDNPSVLLRGGEKSWKNYKARIYLHDIPRWLSLLPSIYSRDVEVIMSEHLSKYGSLLSLLAFRRSGQLSNETCLLHMSHFSEKIRRKAIVVSHMPPFLAYIFRIFVKIYNVVSNELSASRRWRC